jgi:polysaccharide export outer membrane protein
MRKILNSAERKGFNKWLIVAVCLCGIAAAGCRSHQPPFNDVGSNSSAPAGAQTTNAPSSSIVLHEGDTVRITFPGAPTMNTTQLIRRDGLVALPLVGEFKAAGITPREMEKQLVELYGPQLQTREVSVAVESSPFPVYVTGAVLRPGKIFSDRPLTALEAIVEAGGFDYAKANQKAVTITRRQGDHMEHFKLNLKNALKGAPVEQFNLRPSDIIYVPERFAWF